MTYAAHKVTSCYSWDFRPPWLDDLEDDMCGSTKVLISKEWYLGFLPDQAWTWRRLLRSSSSCPSPGGGANEGGAEEFGSLFVCVCLWVV